MRNLGETVARIAAFKKAATATAQEPRREAGGRLKALHDFGSNPGALGAWSFKSQSSGSAVPLVVVLHGCTQSAAAYDHGAGWSALAEQHAFAVLYPEQRRANNANLCFNWFEAGDVRRGQGEAASIAQMIGALVRDGTADPSRVYITGLSAGGAMANGMLASYPELFKGGSIIAGLPYGAAEGVPAAFALMGGQGIPEPARLHLALRQAANHQGPWPTISIWHGMADATVKPVNARAIASQWRGVLDLPDEPSRRDASGNISRQLWLDDDGQALLQLNLVTGMGHGTPVDSDAGGPYMLNVGISSTHEVASQWGLLSEAVGRPVGETILEGEILAPLDDAMPEMPRAADAGLAGREAFIRSTIETALKKAGLLR